MPAPSIAAVLVLLAGSVLPPSPSIRAEGAEASTAASIPTGEPPASMTEVPEPEPRPTTPPPPPEAPRTDGRRNALPVSNPWSVPEVVLAAYRQAVAGSPPACHLPVSLLAAIGQVESGSLAGGSVDASHRAAPPVLGPLLNGVNTAAIRDTDGGALDGSSLWDRAVGPMQFIPGTWAMFGVDGDGDGRADPQNVYDATASAAGYLCAGGRDLAQASGLRSAILSYNHSTAYLAAVLAWQAKFTSTGGGTAGISVTNIPVTPEASIPTTLTATHSTPGLPGTPIHNGKGGNDPVTADPVTADPVTADPVVSRPASRLAFVAGPSFAATSGTAMAAQPAIAVLDSAGNIVTAATSLVTLTLADPSGAALACSSNTETAVSGIARFSGCAIDKTGIHTLRATSGSLTAATSTSVTVFAGTPAAVAAVVGSGQSAVVGRELAIPMVARVTDANANPVPNVSVTFTAPDSRAGASGTFAGSTRTAAALTDADGRATSSVVTASTVSGAYSITATAGSGYATFALTNSPGVSTRFVITSTPVTGPASATTDLGAITVQLQDVYGNPVDAPAGGTDVALTSDSAGTAVFAETLPGASVTTLTIPAGASSGAFYYGDTAPGTPVITVSGLLISATQKETITADPAPLAAATTPTGP